MNSCPSVLARCLAKWPWKDKSGKEVVAGAIHSRKMTDGPFVSIDCGAVPEGIVESELFGVRKHYPGMHNPERLVGKLEASGQGSLLLDEIGNMSFDLQGALLRVPVPRAKTYRFLSLVQQWRFT